MKSMDSHFVELTRNWPLSELGELDADFSPRSPEFSLKVVHVGYFTMLWRLCRMTDEWWVGKDSEISGRCLIEVLPRRKTTKNSLDGRCPGRGLNQVPPDYKFRAWALLQPVQWQSSSYSFLVLGLEVCSGLEFSLHLFIGRRIDCLLPTSRYPETSFGTLLTFILRICLHQFS
jgi:hypothetical protein